MGTGGYYMVGVIGRSFSLYEYYFIADCVHIYYWKPNLYCGTKQMYLHTIEPLNDYSPKYHKNSKCLRFCIDQLCFINSLLQLGIDIYKFSYR